MNKTMNTWDWDVRVRERNLTKKTLEDKDVDRYLSQLPDLTEQTEPISVPQPALGGREG